MAQITNTAPRAIHIAGVLLRPGTPAEVPDDALKGPVVQALLKDKTLTMGELPPEKAAEAMQEKAQEAAGTNAASASATAPKPPAKA